MKKKLLSLVLAVALVLNFSAMTVVEAETATDGGNTASAAVEIELNKEYKGTVSNCISDWFKFTASENLLITITCNTDPCLYFDVYEDSENGAKNGSFEVRYNDPVKMVRMSNEDDSSTLSVAMTPGKTYYIKIMCVCMDMKMCTPGREVEYSVIAETGCSHSNAFDIVGNSSYEIINENECMHITEYGLKFCPDCGKNIKTEEYTTHGVFITHDIFFGVCKYCGYDTGVQMKISREELLASCYHSEPGAWNHDNASILANLGIMNGYEDGTFRPMRKLTRAEAARIMCTLLKVDKASLDKDCQTKFTDVPPSHWASAEIAAMTDMGIIGGYGNGKFGPNDELTQNQLVKLLVVAAGYDAEAREKGGYPTGYVDIAVDMGILSEIDVKFGDYAIAREYVANIVVNALNVSDKLAKMWWKA